MASSAQARGGASTRQLHAWMSAVADVVRAVNAAEPLDELLGRVAEQVCRLVGFDYCAVMLPDDAGEWLAARGSHGLPAEYVDELNRSHALVVDPDGPEADTLAARAFREAVTLTVPDVHRDRRHGSTRRRAIAQGFRALLAAPLPSATGPAGVIVAYSRVAREFTPAEIDMVELLAQHSTLALETTQLRAVQQDTIAELETKREVLEWAEAQHRSLMQLLLDEAGLPRLAESLAGALRCSITIEDVDGTVLAVAPAGTAVPAPGAAARRRRLIRAALESLRERYEVVPVAPTRRDAGHSWVAPVVISGQLVGRLWGTGLTAAPEPAQRRAIERFALVVAVELLKRRYRVDTENRIAGDLVTELLRTDPSPVPDVLRERAAALGCDLDREQVLAVVAVDRAPDQLTDLVRLAAATPPRPLVGTYEGALVVLLPASPDPLAALTRVHERIAGSGRVTTVLGPTVTGCGYAGAFSVAAGAAALCGAGAGVVDLRDLGLAGYLLRTGTTAQLRVFVDRLLGPIEEQDARRGSQLGETLRGWLAAGCSVPGAAAALTVHPNTVAYRLGSIERLVERNLRATQTRMELQLAVTIRDVQRSTPLGDPPGE